MTPQRHDTFISYVRHGRDYEVAVELSDALDEAGLSVWRDQERLLPGQLFFERIILGLRDSKSVLAVISQAALEREWTISEMFVGHAFRKLVPVVIDGTDFSEIPFTIGQTVECVRYERTEDLERIIAGIRDMAEGERSPSPLDPPADWNPPPDGTITAVVSMNLRLGRTDKRHPKFVEMQGRVQRSHQVLSFAQTTNPQLAAAYRLFNDPHRIVPGLLDLKAACEALDRRDLWTALGDVATPFWPDFAVDAYLHAKMSDQEASERLPSTSVEALIEERRPSAEQEASRPLIVEKARAARRSSGIRLRPKSAILPVEGVIATEVLEIPEEPPPELPPGSVGTQEVAAELAGGQAPPASAELPEGDGHMEAPETLPVAEQPADVTATVPERSPPEESSVAAPPLADEVKVTTSETPSVVVPLVEPTIDASPKEVPDEVSEPASPTPRRRLSGVAVGLSASLVLAAIVSVSYVISSRLPVRPSDRSFQVPPESSQGENGLQVVPEPPATPPQVAPAPSDDGGFARSNDQGLVVTPPADASDNSATSARPAQELPQDVAPEPEAPSALARGVFPESSPPATSEEPETAVAPTLPETCAVDEARQLIDCRAEIGDYLWALSERMCGSPLRYLDIWELNRERLGRDDPDLVYVDEVIALPPDCVGGQKAEEPTAP